SQGASLLWGSSGVSSGSVVEVVEKAGKYGRGGEWGWRENLVVMPLTSDELEVLEQAKHFPQRHLMRDANRVKVDFKHFVLELCAVIGSYDDDRRQKKNRNPFQKRYDHS
nr:hypothetical protein [Tanacetum cinerariifolium]